MSGAPTTRRVLDPADRFEEIVFALIMVLTFTCSLGVVDADRADVRDMIIGALGCNLAWGIIDGAFYLIGCLVERGRNSQLVRDVQRAAAAADGRRIIAETLPDAVAEAFEPPDLERFRAAIAALPPPTDRVRFRREEVIGALGVFLLVFLSTFPVVLPFFFLSDVGQALRVSNLIAITLIFGVSFKLAKHSGLRPILTSAAMVGIGVALVAVAIALGG